MALLYRVIWHDTRRDAVETGYRAFAAWVNSKHSFEVPRDGRGESVGAAVADTVSISLDRDDLRAVRCALHEEQDGRRWTTTMTVIEPRNAPPSYWVDLEMVSRDAFNLPPVRRPRLVAELLSQCDAPTIGDTPIRATAREWHGNDARTFVGVVLNPRREVPLLVFTSDPHAGVDVARRRADRAARNLVGVASVELLYPLAMEEVNELLGRELGVWGGGARLYLPGVRQDESGYRHLILPRSALASDLDRAWQIAIDRLATSIAARRAPEEYEAIRTELLPRSGDATLAQLEADYLAEAAENDRLRAAADEAESLRIDAVAELESAQLELANMAARLAYLDRVMAIAAIDASAWTSATQDVTRSVDSPSAAVALAQGEFHRVVIPESATEHVTELDAALECGTWGQSILRALRALETYATEANGRGFWNWCQNSGHPYAWPATPKKLAMSESETAMNAFGDDRRLRVDTAVDPAGVVIMEAHIKVAEGGGQLSPRIYFLDDTGGATGNVHIGFIGPHRYMRNASTN